MTDAGRPVPAVLLAGDSTVAAMPAAETPMSGWGPHLGAALNSRVAAALIAAGSPPRVVPVLNTAQGGATTESHRSDGLWAALLHEARPGDVVVLQFGHNDQKLPHLAADTGYRENLGRFVAEARARGLLPVLCTPVARRHFDGDSLRQTHGEHPDAARALASELGVALLDLTVATAALYAALGPDASRSLFTQFDPGVHPLYPDGIVDDTHFAFAGAVAVADLVADALAPLVVRHLQELPA